MHQRKELRLRDWLKEMIDVGQFYGLKWEDRSRHGWSEKDDAALFRAWATCTKKNKDPRKWKTNLSYQILRRFAKRVVLVERMLTRFTKCSQFEEEVRDLETKDVTGMR